MKKYYFEVDKKQLEKPTEPRALFCAPARVWVWAEDERRARAAAEEKLRARYLGTGTLTGRELRLILAADEPADWSYGYGENRASGTAADRTALRRDCTK